MTNRADPLDNLELLSAACVLAPEVFYARGQAFGVSGEWRRLDGADRQWWIDFSIDLLLKVRPGHMIPFPKAINP